MTRQNQQSVRCFLDISPCVSLIVQGWYAMCIEREGHPTSSIDAAQADQVLSEARHVEGVNCDFRRLRPLMLQQLNKAMPFHFVRLVVSCVDKRFGERDVGRIGREVRAIRHDVLART